MFKHRAMYSGGGTVWILLLSSFQRLQFCDAADLNCVVLRGGCDIQRMNGEERDINHQGYAKRSIRTLDKSWKCRTEIWEYYLMSRWDPAGSIFCFRDVSLGISASGGINLKNNYLIKYIYFRIIDQTLQTRLVGSAEVTKWKFSNSKRSFKD